MEFIKGSREPLAHMLTASCRCLRPDKTHNAAMPCLSKFIGLCWVCKKTLPSKVLIVSYTWEPDQVCFYAFLVSTRVQTDDMVRHGHTSLAQIINDYYGYMYMNL